MSNAIQNPTTAPQNITVISDWSQVALTGFESSVSGATANWKAQEFLTGTVDQAKRYIYILFAKKGNDRSPPAWGGTPAEFTVPTPSFTATVVGEIIQIRWDAAAGAEYILEYAEVKSKNNAGTAESTLTGGNYELVTDYKGGVGQRRSNPRQVLPGQGMVNHKPGVQKNYIYRLTPRVNEVLENPATQIVASGLYTTVVDLLPTQIIRAGDAANTIHMGLTGSGGST